MENAQLHRAAGGRVLHLQLFQGQGDPNPGRLVEAVAVTILEGARLEMLLEHDRLGLDAEMEFLTEAVDNGQAQQICVIQDILERLTQDQSVLEKFENGH